MARPKRDAEEKKAFERIEDAFWQILSEKPYNKITISALSKAAGVNHNLIYYYFDNIDDMAKQLFERNMSAELPDCIIGLVFEGNISHEEILRSEEMLKRINRVRLFMRSDSAYLNGIVKERLQKGWLSAIGVEKSQLSHKNLVDLEFIFSGIVSIVGSSLFEENPESVATIYQRTLGKAVAETLKEFARQQVCTK